MARWWGWRYWWNGVRATVAAPIHALALRVYPDVYECGCERWQCEVDEQRPMLCMMRPQLKTPYWVPSEHRPWEEGKDQMMAAQAYFMKLRSKRIHKAFGDGMSTEYSTQESCNIDQAKTRAGAEYVPIADDAVLRLLSDWMQQGWKPCYRCFGNELNMIREP